MGQNFTGYNRFEGVVKKGAGVVVLELAEKRNLFVCRPGDLAQAIGQTVS